GSGGSFSFTPQAADTYMVSVVATNDGGLTGTDSTSVAVTGSGVGILGASSVLEGQTYTLALEPGSMTVDHWVIHWTTGDSSGDQTVSGSPTSVTHTYSSAGDVTITATAVDGSSSTLDAGQSVGLSVLPVTPAVTITGAPDGGLATVGDQIHLAAD